MTIKVEDLTAIREYLESNLRSIYSLEYDTHVQNTANLEILHPPNRQTCYEGLKDVNYYKVII